MVNLECLNKDFNQRMRFMTLTLKICTVRIYIFNRERLLFREKKTCLPISIFSSVIIKIFKYRNSMSRWLSHKGTWKKKITKIISQFEKAKEKMVVGKTPYLWHSSIWSFRANDWSFFLLYVEIVRQDPLVSFCDAQKQ